MSMANILLALDDVGPMKQTELSQFLGISNETVYLQLKALKKAGKVHITRFARQPAGKRGSPSPVFAIGAGKDAEKPAPKTQTQRTREYQQRHKAIIAVRRLPPRRIALGVWAGLGALPGRESAQSSSY